MATVQLADIYNPLVFAQAVQEAQVELNRFIQSGVAVMDPTINAMASTGGNIGELPFYKPLGTEEPNYSTDNPATLATPAKITSDKMIYRLASQNKSWSVMDLSRELSLADPVAAITGRIAQYWATNNEKRIIQSVRGLLADNIANDSGDMLFDISVATDGTVGAANLADGAAMIDAQQTMGDHASMLRAVAMHSRVYANLRKLQLIAFVRDADNNTMFATYGDHRVIVDDSLVGVTYGTTKVNTYYDTIFFGAGEIALGEGTVTTPSEFDRNPDAGNGGGEYRLYSRRSDIIHPLGFKFTSSSVAGQSATQAELAVAANWDRVYNRKNVSLAVLRSNG